MLNFAKVFNYKSDSDEQEFFKESLLINFIGSATCFFFIYSVNNYFINSIAGFYIMFSAGALLTILSFLLNKKLISFIKAVNVGNFVAYVALAVDVYYTGGIQSPTLAWIILLPMASFLMLEKCFSTSLWLILSVLLIIIYGSIGISGITLVNNLGEKEFPIFLTTSYVGLAIMLAIMTNLFDSKKRRIFDLLEAKQLELFNSEKRFRIIFEKAPLGISVANSVTGEIEELNLKFAEIVGRKEGEIKIMGWESFTHPEDVQEDRESMSKLLKKEISEYKQTKRYIRKDGSIIWVDMSISPIETKDNENQQHICIIEDITERKRIESIQIVKEQNSLLLSHASQVPGVLYQVQLSAENQISIPFVSDGVLDLFEVRPEDVMADAKLILHSVHEEDIENVKKTMSYSMKTLTNWVQDFRIVLKSNEIRWLRGNSKPEVLKNGNIISHGYIIDITKQKEFEQIEKQKNKDILAQQNSLLELNMLSTELNFNEKIRSILVNTSQTLKNERVSFWEWEGNNLSTKYFYKLSTDQYLEGERFTKSNCETFFTELLLSKNIIAYDVFANRATMDLSEYYIQNKISSLVAIPIQKGSESIGVICFENVGPKRNWSHSEITFIRSIADLIILAFESEELKKAKDEIHLKEERWKFAIEGSTDGMWDWNVLTNEIYRSARWSEMIGFDPSEIENTLEAYTLRIHPDDIEMVTEELHKHFRSEIPSYSTEHRVQCKDGSYKWILDRGKVIVWNDDKTPQRVVGTKTDITERKTTENNLEKSEERLKLVLAGTNDGWWDWDLIENKLYFSPRWWNMFGYLENEIEMQPDVYPKYLHPEDRARVENSFTACLDNGTSSYEIECRFLNKKGDYISILSRGYILRNSNNVPIRVSGSDMDLTDRKQAEAQIKQSLEEKEVLLKEVHHRVKNNLQIISSILNLQSSTIADKQTLDLLKNSQDRIRSMSLIHELLYQTKDFSTINFSEYIRSIATNLFQSYNQNRLVNLVLELEPVFLDLDSAIPCGLIINELITNSLKYAYNTDDEGDVRINLTLTNNIVIIIIEDTGKGFPTTIDFRETESLGMQLVISLTDQIDGEIKMENSQGTRFEIQFKNNAKRAIS
jgi:PAS domain S-box-containing protein